MPDFQTPFTVQSFGAHTIQPLSQHLPQTEVCFLPVLQPRDHLPLIVLLPGMDGTGLLLRRQAEYLSQSFDVRCLSIPLQDRSDWPTLAQQVIQLIQAERDCDHSIDPKRAIYLCGESFGGCLALQVIQDAPDLCDRLILVNPASSFNQRPWIRWGSALTHWIPEPLYRASMPGFLAVLAALNRLEVSDRRQLLQVTHSVPQSTSVWRTDLLRNFDLTLLNLANLKQPTLILASASDRLLPSVAEAERLSNFLPNSETVILPDSGHACLLEPSINLHTILEAHHFLPIQPDLTVQSEPAIVPAAQLV